ncbi:MAG TPA: hypothetical protein ENK57_18250, partial [Polyangiaceae bacterium]|nr:hypothetical protein [Polyangiaceae bacterium]
MPSPHNSILCLVVSLTLVPTAAEAQDAHARARALFGQGVDAMDANNPAAAVTYFEQSYTSYARASTACNLALALERTARGCEAVRWYQQCAALDSQGAHRDQANA